MKYRFADLIDVARVQRLSDLFSEATGMATAVIDLEGVVLTGSGWRGLCTEFHRVNPESRTRCIESDTVIANQVAAGQRYTMYRCRNGLIDAATPITIEGEHVANFFTGQFLLHAPDMELFRAQARHYGFDESAYMAAVEKIPVIDKAKVHVFLDYFSEFAQMLGEMGMRHLLQTEAEKALRERDERMNKAQEIAHLGSWELDLAENRLSWSDEVYRIFGLRPQEFAVTYEAFLDRVHPEDRAAVDAAYSGSIVERRDSYEIEHRVVRRPSGQVRTVLERCEHIRDEGGRIVKSMGMVHDITERKEAEEALRRARDELEQRVRERTAEVQAAYERLQEEIAGREQLQAQLRQAQKMEALGTLSGGIAHDFNNILAAIIGFTELAAGRAAKGSRDERHLARVMEASLRGRELVRQMLTFSRKMEQEKKPLQLSSVVKETTRLLRASIPTTIGMKTRVKSESGVILGDPTQIQQVLMNLCMNAADAMREKGGTLDIELSDFSVSPSKADECGMEPGLYMKLVVRDTGIGISPHIIDRIFDPFFTTKRPGEGTGLGLSVVHGIVQQSDGHITAESEQGKGSVFSVYFPKISTKPTGETTGEDHAPTGDEHILFVDDEEALVEMGEDILAELGYDVTSCTSATEALALVKEDPDRFDLIVTDQTMPDLTGIELAREVLAIGADIPIIICTGFSRLVDADTAKEAGIRAFAMKPLTKGEIAKTIRLVLDEHR